MARALRITPVAPSAPGQSVLLGSGTGAGNTMTDSDNNKLVKLVGDSRYDLCASGDEIQGYVMSVEQATNNGYSMGTIQKKGAMYVTFAGLQATEGTGVLAIGDYVVAGTPVARNTLPVNGAAPKVCKATAAVTSLTWKWRVVSLGAAGTGAVGTVGVVERIEA